MTIDEWNGIGILMTLTSGIGWFIAGNIIRIIGKRAKNKDLRESGIMISAFSAVVFLLLLTASWSYLGKVFVVKK